MTIQRVKSPAEKKMEDLVRRRRGPGFRGGPSGSTISGDPFTPESDDFTQAVSPIQKRIRETQVGQPSPTVQQASRPKAVDGGFDFGQAVSGFIERGKQGFAESSAPFRGMLGTAAQMAIGVAAPVAKAVVTEPSGPGGMTEQAIWGAERWDRYIARPGGLLGNLVFGGSSDPEAGEKFLFSPRRITDTLSREDRFSLSRWKEMMVGEKSIARRKASVAAFLAPVGRELTGEQDFDIDARVDAATDKLNLFKGQQLTAEVVFDVTNFIGFGALKASAKKLDTLAKNIGRLVNRVPPEQVPDVAADMVRKYPVVAGAAPDADEFLDMTNDAIVRELEELESAERAVAAEMPTTARAADEIPTPDAAAVTTKPYGAEEDITPLFLIQGDAPDFSIRGFTDASSGKKYKGISVTGRWGEFSRGLPETANQAREQFNTVKAVLERYQKQLGAMDKRSAPYTVAGQKLQRQIDEAQPYYDWLSGLLDDIGEGKRRPPLSQRLYGYGRVLPPTSAADAPAVPGAVPSAQPVTPPAPAPVAPGALQPSGGPLSPEEVASERSRLFNREEVTSEATRAATSGEPFTVYHGSRAVFDVADIESRTPSYLGDIGEGIYFAADPDTALMYGDNLYRTTLRMNNPLVIDPENFDVYRSVPELEGESVLVGETMDKFDVLIGGEWHQVRNGSDLSDIGGLARDAGHDAVIATRLRAQDEILVLDRNVIEAAPSPTATAARATSAADAIVDDMESVRAMVSKPLAKNINRWVMVGGVFPDARVLRVTIVKQYANKDNAPLLKVFQDSLRAKFGEFLPVFRVTGPDGILSVNKDEYLSVTLDRETAEWIARENRLGDEAVIEEFTVPIDSVRGVGSVPEKELFVDNPGSQKAITPTPTAAPAPGAVADTPTPGPLTSQPMTATEQAARADVDAVEQLKAMVPPEDAPPGMNYKRIYDQLVPYATTMDESLLDEQIQLSTREIRRLKNEAAKKPHLGSNDISIAIHNLAIRIAKAEKVRRATTTARVPVAQEIGKLSNDAAEALDDIIDGAGLDENLKEAFDAYIDPYGDADSNLLEALFDAEAFTLRTDIAERTQLHIAIEYGLADVPNYADELITVFRGRHINAPQVPNTAGTSVSTDRAFVAHFNRVIMPGRRSQIPDKDWVVDELSIPIRDVMAPGHTGESELLVRTGGLQPVTPSTQPVTPGTRVSSYSTSEVDGKKKYFVNGDEVDRKTYDAVATAEKRVASTRKPKPKKSNAVVTMEDGQEYKLNASGVSEEFDEIPNTKDGFADFTVAMTRKMEANQAAEDAKAAFKKSKKRKSDEKKKPTPATGGVGKGVPPSDTAGLGAVQDEGDSIDDIMETFKKSVISGESEPQTLLRLHEAAIKRDERLADELVHNGNQLLLNAGIGLKKGRTVAPRQEDIPRLDELFEALHNPSKVKSGEIAIPSGFEDIYKQLREYTDMDEMFRLDFDPNLGTVEDYFYRGWNPPDEAIIRGKGGQLGIRPNFKKPRIDASYRQMRDLGFEPLFWNPFEQWRASRLQTIRTAQQKHLVTMLAQLDKNGSGFIQQIPATGVIPRNRHNWRTPRVGPAMEGRRFIQKDKNGRPFIKNIKGYIVPPEVANALENIYGKKPSLDMKVKIPGSARISGTDRYIDVMKMIDWLTFVPKRAKLFGSLFQQMDFMRRAGIGAWSRAFDAAIAGEPIEAVMALARFPKTMGSMVLANFSPNYRHALRSQLNDATPLFSGRNISIKSISDAGLSTIDASILPDDIDRIARSAAEDAGVLHMKKVGRGIREVEGAMRRGLFDGVYPAAIIADVRNNIAPSMVHLYPKATDEQLAGMIAKAANIRYSVIPASQSVFQKRAIRETLRRVFFSINESEGLIKAGLGAFSGPNKKFWIENWIGTFLFMITTANVIHFASTGQPLPKERYVPIVEDDFAKFGVAYNRTFASPTLPFTGRGGTEITLDLMSQMDTAFRLLDPNSFVDSRLSVPIKAIQAQVSGEAFAGEPIGDVGPSLFGAGGISRAAQFLTDLFSPIGPGQGIAEIARRVIPGASDILPVDAEASRLGPIGTTVQSMGENVLAETSHDFRNRLARESGFEDVYGKPITKWADLNIRQKKKIEAANKAEFETRHEAGLRRGQESAVIRKTFDDIEAVRIEQEEALSSEFISGSIPGVEDYYGLMSTIRERYRDIQGEAAIKRAQTNEIFQQFQEDGELPEDPLKRAVVQYYDTFDTATSPAGIFDYDALESALEKLEAEWTPAQQRYVDASTGHTEHTPLIDAIRIGSKTLSDSDYWDMKDSAKERMARRDPDIDKALVVFYGRAPKSSEGRRLKRRLDSAYEAGNFDAIHSLILEMFLPDSQVEAASDISRTTPTVPRLSPVPSVSQPVTGQHSELVPVTVR